MLRVLAALGLWRAQEPDALVREAERALRERRYERAADLARQANEQTQNRHRAWLADRSAARVAELLRRLPAGIEGVVVFQQPLSEAEFGFATERLPPSIDRNRLRAAVIAIVRPGLIGGLYWFDRPIAELPAVVGPRAVSILEPDVLAVTTTPELMEALRKPSPDAGFVKPEEAGPGTSVWGVRLGSGWMRRRAGSRNLEVHYGAASDPDANEVAWLFERDFRKERSEEGWRFSFVPGKDAAFAFHCAMRFIGFGGPP